MKKIFVLLAIVNTCFIFGQDNQRTNPNMAQALTDAGKATKSSYGATMFYINPEINVYGSVYLFENWNNQAIIHTSDNQKYVLKNINLNLEQNTFDSKIGQDSMFAFSANNIDKMVINNLEFRNYAKNGKNKIYQIVYSEESFQLLKGYKIRLIKGSTNPMVNRPSDKYVKTEYFFVRRENEIKSFKVKKKNVLDLVANDEEKADEIMELLNN